LANGVTGFVNYAMLFAEPAADSKTFSKQRKLSILERSTDIQAVK
jgi:hypothetical protein